jgi:SAM-dependent methyltransferase
MTATTVLSASEAVSYWDKRHLAGGALHSGGDMSFDEPANHIFYALRLGLLVDIIGHQSSPDAPLFVLDAGCGKGWFSRRLAGFGHQVDAIDPSDSALAICRERGGGPRYFESTLSGWRSRWLYDVVKATDVLFHIMDDDEWAASVRNLASLVRVGGRLIVADWGKEGDLVVSNYLVVRGRGRYLPLLAECGMRFDGWRPYRFRQNNIGYYIFTRIG